MKNIFKITLFIFIFLIIFFSLSYFMLPKENVKRFGFYKTSLYSILGEKDNTIDVLAIGDSLVYSSISPMEIYGRHGYTVYDCSAPAQLISDTYEYYKIALKTQKPKVVLIEANVLFRDASKKPYYDKYLKLFKYSTPLFLYHDNWKNIFIKDKHNDYNKGFMGENKIKPSKNINYMKKTGKIRNIPKENIKYLEKIIALSEKNKVKLIFVGLPSQKSWNYAKHSKVKMLSKKYGFTYINFNLNKYLKIDWKKDTKDRGDHLNIYGSKKVSEYLGNYLKDLEILKVKKNNPKYKEWDKLYIKYLENN